MKVDNEKLLLFLIVTIFFFLLISVTSIDIISAQDNRFVASQNQPLDIQESCFFNGTYCSNTAICNITIIDPTKTILVDNQIMSNMGSYHLYSLSLNQTSSLGSYSCSVVCCDGSLCNFDTFTYDITPNGENPSTAKGMIYIGLLIVLFVLFIFMIIGGIKADYVSIKTFMFLFAYLVLLGISFISWNLSNDYITSSPFLTSIFRIMFYFLLIALFPTILISIVYLLYMLMSMKAIKRMIDRGIPEDEAYEREVRGGLKNIFKNR